MRIQVCVGQECSTQEKRGGNEKRMMEKTMEITKPCTDEEKDVCDACVGVWG